MTACSPDGGDASDGDTDGDELAWRPLVSADLDTPIAFHMQNHGYNTWALLEISAAVP